MKDTSNNPEFFILPQEIFPHLDYPHTLLRIFRLFELYPHEHYFFLPVWFPRVYPENLSLYTAPPFEKKLFYDALLQHLIEISEKERLLALHRIYIDLQEYWESPPN